MTTRALLFDIGNTRLKWGVLESGHIKRTGMLAHDKLAERGFGALTAKLPANVDAVLASASRGVHVRAALTTLADVINVCVARCCSYGGCSRLLGNHR